MADIRSALTINSSQFQTAITSATTAVSGLGSKLVDVGNTGNASLNKLSSAAETVRNKMNGIGGAIVGAGLVAFAHSSLESVSNMVDLANAIGVTTQSMMEMNLAALAAGQSGESIAKMIQKMNIAAQSAADGNTKLESTFNSLGISMDYLRSHSPEQAFQKAAAALGEMSDSGKRATLSMELFSKGGTTAVWKDLAEGITKYSGTQEKAAASTLAAKKVMDELSVGAQEVKNQFVLLASPVTEWIAPMIDGLGGAKIAAVGLAGAMGLFAAAGTITAIKTVVGTVNEMATAMGISAGAATAEATAISAANTSKLASVGIEAARSSAKAKTLQIQVAETQALLANAEAAAAAGVTTATLEKLQWRLAVAQAAAAGDASALAAAQMALAGAEAVAIPTTVGLTASISALGMATLRAAAPLAAITLILGSAVAVFQMVADLAKGGRGDNFINDFFEESLGIDDKTLQSKADEIRRIASLSTEQKAAYDKMNSEEKQAIMDAMKNREEAAKLDKANKFVNPVITSQTQVDSSALDAIKAQGLALQSNNNAIQKKLALEIESVGLSATDAAKKMAQFEAEDSIRQSTLKTNQEIAKLEAQAQALTGVDDTKKKQLLEQSAELKKQLDLSNGQVEAVVRLKGALVDAQNAEKLITADRELGLKIYQEEVDLRREIGLIGATNEEKALADIQKRIDAEVQGAIKIREAQNGNKPIGKEAEEKVRADITPKYDEEKQLALSLSKANDAEAIRVAYMSTEQKIAENIRTLQHDADELTMTNDQIKLNGIKRRIDAEVDGIVRIREAQNGGKPIGQDEVDKIRAELTPKFEEEKAATQALIGKSSEFSTGWERSWKQYADDATNAAKQAEDVFNAMTTAADSAFDKLIGDSDATWKEIFNNAVKQMMKSDFKNALGSLMNSVGGSSSNGGFFSSLGKMFAGGFANGGYIPAGSYGITGENGPETVNGPATITPMQNGVTNYITIQAWDGTDVQRVLSQYSDLLYGLTIKGQRAAGG